MIPGTGRFSSQEPFSFVIVIIFNHHGWSCLEVDFLPFQPEYAGYHLTVPVYCRAVFDAVSQAAECLLLELTCPLPPCHFHPLST